jgi:hypothetical protein
MESSFITGEYFQQQADIYVGFREDFEYNPVISRQTEKHMSMDHALIGWNNPYRIFCYSHRLRMFIERVLPFLQNPFVLISHNSDENICGDWPLIILQNPLLETWYAQNACISHAKLVPLPIGLANSQWAHGNLRIFREVLDECIVKRPASIYFQFKVETHFEKRSACMTALWGKLGWLCETSFEGHLERLASHEFCICPEGNGMDTHRFWECMYLRVVPIVLQSPFIEALRKQYGLPMVVLESWEDLDVSSLDFSRFSFPDPRIFHICF